MFLMPWFSVNPSSPLCTLMQNRLINDAVYHEGSMCLINDNKWLLGKCIKIAQPQREDEPYHESGNSTSPE